MKKYVLAIAVAFGVGFGLSAYAAPLSSQSSDAGNRTADHTVQVAHGGSSGGGGQHGGSGNGGQWQGGSSGGERGHWGSNGGGNWRWGSGENHWRWGYGGGHSRNRSHWRLGSSY